jgi:hypothetical protein
MKRLVAFTATTQGRILQIVLGIALLVGGIFGTALLLRLLFIALGITPLLAGIFDICILAPIVKYPLQGAKVRTRKRRYR